jgi:hypothetical protein
VLKSAIFERIGSFIGEIETKAPDLKTKKTQSNDRSEKKLEAGIRKQRAKSKESK